MIRINAHPERRRQRQLLRGPGEQRGDDQNDEGSFPIDLLSCIKDNIDVIEVRQSETFRTWHEGMRNTVARAIIARRIDRLAGGNLGDAKLVGGKVTELRIHHGPGYRVYLTRQGGVLVILLCGGDKSTQAADIKLAQAMAAKVTDDDA